MCMWLNLISIHLIYEIKGSRLVVLNAGGENGFAGRSGSGDYLKRASLNLALFNPV